VARTAVPRRLSWLVATVKETKDETATARTLILDVPGWPGHVAGQHVTVKLTAEDGYSTQRDYSIANAATAGAEDASRVEITVQRLEDGEVSPYLTDVLRPGDPLELRGPIGGWFVWRPEEPAPTLLTGGGSGVVPLMAMIRTRIARGSGTPMRLIYSTRGPDTLLYHEELQRLSDQDPALRVDLVYTRRAPAGWEGKVGRLGAAQLAALAWPPADQPASFVCGPTSFVEAVANLLIDQGHDPQRIKTERFGPSGS
jgi:ferredoxin-NADP reductase